MENPKPSSDSNVEPQDPTPGTASTDLSRRKIIDRREGNKAEEMAKGDRRDSEDRRDTKVKVPASTSQTKQLTQLQIKIQQHRKKKLLAGCEACMGMNFDTLAMDDYPSNEVVAEAKRDRDYWIVVCTVCASIFLLGLIGLVPAIIAGIACGAAVLGFMLAFSPLRQRFFDSPSLTSLMVRRKAIEFRALTHIQFMEGDTGLAWRCEHMRKYNNNLGRKLFRGLVQSSRAGNMLDIIRTKKQIRLYLLFMIESQKAYKRLQQDYLDNHFKNVEQGWDDTLQPNELAKVKQEDLEEVPQPTQKK
jgi:hypothetical protein